jgi:hypothetical protein
MRNDRPNILGLKLQNKRISKIKDKKSLIRIKIISSQNWKRWARGVAQAVGHLLSNRKVLSTSPSTAKTN